MKCPHRRAPRRRAGDHDKRRRRLETELKSTLIETRLGDLEAKVFGAPHR
jgi:hypothetical protein